MTITEFHAWLDGFSEAVGDAPTPDQWAKVLAKLRTVQALSVPQQTPLAPRPLSPSWPNLFVTCGRGQQQASTVDEGTRVVSTGHAVSG